MAGLSSLLLYLLLQSASMLLGSASRLLGSLLQPHPYAMRLVSFWFCILQEHFRYAWTCATAPPCPIMQLPIAGAYECQDQGRDLDG